MLCDQLGVAISWQGDQVAMTSSICCGNEKKRVTSLHPLPPSPLRKFWYCRPFTQKREAVHCDQKLLYPVRMQFSARDIMKSRAECTSFWCQEIGCTQLLIAPLHLLPGKTIPRVLLRIYERRVVKGLYLHRAVGYGTAGTTMAGFFKFMFCACANFNVGVVA